MRAVARKHRKVRETRVGRCKGAMARMPSLLFRLPSSNSSLSSGLRLAPATPSSVVHLSAQEGNGTKCPGCLALRLPFPSPLLSGALNCGPSLVLPTTLRGKGARGAFCHELFPWSPSTPPLSAVQGRIQHTRPLQAEGYEAWVAPVPRQAFAKWGRAGEKCARGRGGLAEGGGGAGSATKAERGEMGREGPGRGGGRGWDGKRDSWRVES